MAGPKLILFDVIGLVAIGVGRVHRMTAGNRLPNFPHDLVNLIRVQGGRLFLQLGTPGGQDSVLAGIISCETEFLSKLVDRRFPDTEIHR